MSIKQNPQQQRIDEDEAFIAHMESLRLYLAHDIKQNNPDISDESLNQMTHNCLNRLLMCRILEDRNVESFNFFYRNVNVFDGLVRKNEGDEQNTIQPQRGDGFNISDSTLKEVIHRMHPVNKENPLGCSYDFQGITLQGIGRIHEVYLGKQLKTINGQIELATTPDVRFVGGVYYTPAYIAEFMVRELLQPLVKGKNTRRNTST